VTLPDDRPRRSVYAQVRRTRPAAFLSTFDAPFNELNCAQRTFSAGAPQALTLMNSEFILSQARAFAQRVQAEVQADHDRLAKLAGSAWLLAYQRPATLAEVELACDFLDRQIRQFRAASRRDAELAALPNLCQQLLASNEFLYVD